jgi:hypothetical protein
MIPVRLEGTWEKNIKTNFKLLDLTGVDLSGW